MDELTRLIESFLGNFLVRHFRRRRRGRRHRRRCRRRHRHRRSGDPFNYSNGKPLNI